MDKNFYFFADNKGLQHGPVRHDYFKQHGISSDTLVWFDGLPNWIEAKDATTLKRYISQNGVESMEQPAHYHEFIKGQIPANVKLISSHVTTPKSWVTESVLLTIFCSFIPGIIALLYGSRVGTLWSNKQYAKSLRYSYIASQWVKWGFTITVVLAAIYIVVSLLLPQAYFSVMHYNNYLENRGLFDYLK